MLGSVYFVQEAANGPIKIGWTEAEPEKRRAALQIGNSNELVLLGAISNCRPDAEAYWHERFIDARKRSEWFYPTRALIDAIKAALDEERQPAILTHYSGPQASKAEVEAWLSENNVSMGEFAERLDQSRQHVLYALRDPSHMRPKLAYRIERVTEGAIKAEALLKWFRAWKLAHAQKDWEGLRAIGVNMSPNREAA